SSAAPATRPASLTLVILPRTSVLRGTTSMPLTTIGSSSVATNVSPALLRSLLTLSTMRTTIFDPVGTVHPIFAALLDGGLAGGRADDGASRGSEEGLTLPDGVVRTSFEVDGLFEVVAVSSPN